MSLSDTSILNAKPPEKPIKLADGGGLYLLLKPNGAKWWRVDYRFTGKRKTLSMGVYREVGLRAARDKRDEAKRLLADGIDPGENRKIQKAARSERAENSFEVVAREWFAKFSPNWADSHAVKIIRRLSETSSPGLELDRLLRSKLLSCCAQSKKQRVVVSWKRLTVRYKTAVRLSNKS